MEKFFENYTINDVSKVVEEIKIMEIKIREFKELKERLENYFNFKIVDYIVSDILDCETYNHVCLMINLAVVSNRISSENSITLKNGLKKLFQINNIFDKELSLICDQRYNLSEITYYLNLILDFFK